MNIFVSQEYSPSSLALLKQELPDAEVISFNPKNVQAGDLKNADALLIRSNFPIHKNLLKETSKLKWVTTSTSGFDHIDLQACADKNIKVSFTPDGNVQSVVELTTWFIIESQRQVNLFSHLLKKRKWKRDRTPSQEVSGKTLGIIGFGRIGSQVAKVAQALGMNVVTYDPFIEPEHISKQGVEAVGLSEIFRLADILSLHVPLSASTRGMINEKTLEMMPTHGFLINTSRGQVVKEVALLEALKSNQIAGAALDVFNSEPLPDDAALRNLPNILLSPHIGAYTEQAFAAVSDQAAQQTIAFFKHEQHQNPLPPQAPWFTAEKPS